MRIKNTIFLICILMLINFQTSLADQLTITFTNPVPAAPVNCGDTWSEQGVEMEMPPILDNNCPDVDFTYGNGNLLLNIARFRVNLSQLGYINNITMSIVTGCYDNIYFISNNQTVHSDNISANPLQLIIYDFSNENNIFIEYMDVVNSECPGSTILDITIDYTPICESEPISNVRNGDVYLNDACYGVIMTSPSGNCFRAKVADSGMLFTEPVECL